MTKKEYIGDGCYVDFDGYALTLTTEQGMGYATNTIVLEPEVFSNLVQYRARVFGAALPSSAAEEPK